MDMIERVQAHKIAERIAIRDAGIKKLEKDQKADKAELTAFGVAKYEVDGSTVAVEGTEKLKIDEDTLAYLRKEHQSFYRRNRVTTIPTKAARALMEISKAFARRVHLESGIRISVRKAKG